MTPIDGSDIILLMLTGLTVVLITLQLVVRAHRNKQKAIKQHYSARRPSSNGDVLHRETTSGSAGGQDGICRGILPTHPEPAQRMVYH